jgi:hypothetical protein
MTDARLHSDRPIDDEVPFEEAEDVPRDEAPEDEDALVTPAATERTRTPPDDVVDKTERRPTGR